MDRGAWQTIVHGLIESETTELITTTDVVLAQSLLGLTVIAWKSQCQP